MSDTTTPAGQPAPVDPAVARVRAGHGLDTPTRPGGLLGPLPAHARAAELDGDTDTTTEEQQ